MFPNEIVMNINVFGTCVHDGVMSQGNATLIISVNDDCVDLEVSEVLNVGTSILRGTVKY